MFPNSYLAPSYFAGTYFPPIVILITKSGGKVSARETTFLGHQAQHYNRLLREDEELVAVVIACLQTGTLK